MNGYINFIEDDIYKLIDYYDRETEYGSDTESEMRIEDLELVEDSNVLIYINGEVKKEEFENIYSGVRVMITTKNTIDKDRWRYLPRQIKKIIIVEVYGDYTVYDINDISNIDGDEFEMIRFMSKRYFNKYLEEIMTMRKELMNKQNKNGETILMLVCYHINNIKTKKMDEILQMIEEETYNKMDKKNMIALDYLFDGEHRLYNTEERIINEIVNKTKKELYNKYDNYGQTLIMKIIDRQEEYYDVYGEIIKMVEVEEIKSKYLKDAIYEGRSGIIREMIRNIREKNINEEMRENMRLLEKLIPELYEEIK